MNYVDGFVCAVPDANREAYRDHAEQAATIFRRHGALQVVEAWGDDVPEGETNSFHTAVMRRPDETVVFSWVLWPSREARDAGMKRVRDDFQSGDMPPEMPFDGKRMIFGGFRIIVEG